jgi:ABC-type antimicrobial peptide transport system permease subunit
MLTVKSAVRRVIFGMVVGIPVAWAASKSVQAMLFGLTPADPLTFAGAALLLMASALLAAYLPARRASRVDPMTALRHE